MSATFSQWMGDIQQRTESALDRALPGADIAPSVIAMVVSLVFLDSRFFMVPA